MSQHCYITMWKVLVAWPWTNHSPVYQFCVNPHTENKIIPKSNVYSLFITFGINLTDCYNEHRQILWERIVQKKYHVSNDNFWDRDINSRMWYNKLLPQKRNRLFSKSFHHTFLSGCNHDMEYISTIQISWQLPLYL